MKLSGWLVLGCVVFAGCNGGGGAMDMGGSDAGSDASTPPDISIACTTDVSCDDGVYCNGPETCHPAAAGADAHGCVHGAAPCLASMTCDETTRTCVTSCATGGDADGDGHPAISCGGDDCDDADAHRYPGNLEVCDAVDQDCDPATFGTLDGDRDGYVSSACCNPAASGPPTCGDDCDDLTPDVHPTATEACDGFDNDCNGMVDEGVSVTVYPDTDRDGSGDMGATAVMRCAGAVGFSATADDCAPMDLTVHPGAPEICDGRDNDCNGMVDDGTTAVVWYADLDGDGFGSARSGTQSSCEPLAGFSLLGTDCDDTRHGVSPAANELCNGRDDDCNGLADFRIAPNDFEDDDADGHADAHCSPAGDDCDDRDVNVYPGAAEICDGKDDDCNGVSDDMTGAVAWIPDADGDSYGDDSGTPTMSCTQPAGRVQRGGDCDDSDASRHPGAVDVCNGHDDNCNSVVDEDAAQTAYWPAGSDADGDGAAASSAMPTLTCMTPPTGAVHAGGDCDDTRGTVGPGEPELCNLVDDDCNGMVDDGLGSITCSMGSGATMCSRTVPACAAGVAASCSALPAIQDVCNGRDDDCDGTVDETPDAPRSCMAPHATASCAAGACVVVSCGLPYADCNHVAADGCEQDTDTSTSACGACGRSCGSGDTCVRGHCSSEVLQLGLGDHLSCALLGSGAVYCWGDNGHGQIGMYGATTGSPPPSFDVATPVVFDSPTGSRPPLTDATQVAVGSNFACALRLDGTIWCWGANGNCQLGLYADVTDRVLATRAGWSSPTPRKILAFGSVQYVVTGAGDVWWVGREFNYEVGDGNSVNNSAGQYFRAMTGGTHVLVAQDLVVGPSAALGLDTVTATWFATGTNYSDHLLVGAGSAASNGMSPSALADVRLLALGINTTCRVSAVTTDVYCIGANDRGQLGRDTSGGPDGTWHATGSSGSRGLAMYANHSCAIDDSGFVDCWGGNEHGQLGNGATADTHVVGEVTVPGLSATNPATVIAVGLDHSCAALADGTIYCWGGNAFGQLGDGTFVDRHAPLMPVSGLP